MKDYNYDGKIYKVSSQGVVYSSSGKTMALVDNGTGYLQVTLNSCNKRKKIYIHRIVWTVFKGEIPEWLEIDHIDNNKKNNCLKNLCLKTRKKNMEKMLKENPHVMNNLIQNR